MPLKKLINYLVPDKSNISHFGIVISSLSAFVSIFVIVAISSFFVNGVGFPILVASMGASAIILFVVSSSPMAKPWPLIGGHLIAAFIGVTCSRYIPSLMVATAVAVCISILFMHYLRCIHPPGGAAAVAAVIGGSEIHSLGYQFVLTPVGLNVATMFLMGVIYNEIVVKIFAPKTEDAKKWEILPNQWPNLHSDFEQNDLSYALKALDRYIDITDDDLKAIYRLAVTHAQSRHLHDKLCNDIMQRNVKTVNFGTELEEVWGIFKKFELHGVPVVDRANRVIGILTFKDFERHASHFAGNSLTEKIKSLVTRTPGFTSDKPEVAGQIMTTKVISIHFNETVKSLIKLMRVQNIHHLPVVDDEKKLVGMVTTRDLTNL